MQQLPEQPQEQQAETKEKTFGIEQVLSALTGVLFCEDGKYLDELATFVFGQFISEKYQSQALRLLHHYILEQLPQLQSCDEVPPNIVVGDHLQLPNIEGIKKWIQIQSDKYGSSFILKVPTRQQQIRLRRLLLILDEEQPKEEAKITSDPIIAKAQRSHQNKSLPIEKIASLIPMISTDTSFYGYFKFMQEKMQKDFLNHTHPQVWGDILPEYETIQFFDLLSGIKSSITEEEGFELQTKRDQFIKALSIFASRSYMMGIIVPPPIEKHYEPVLHVSYSKEFMILEDFTNPCPQMLDEIHPSIIPKILSLRSHTTLGRYFLPFDLPIYMTCTAKAYQIIIEDFPWMKLLFFTTTNNNTLYQGILDVTMLQVFPMSVAWLLLASQILYIRGERLIKHYFTKSDQPHKEEDKDSDHIETFQILNFDVGSEDDCTGIVNMTLKSFYFNRQKIVLNINNNNNNENPMDRLGTDIWAPIEFLKICKQIQIHLLPMTGGSKISRKHHPFYPQEMVLYPHRISPPQNMTSGNFRLFFKVGRNERYQFFHTQKIIEQVEKESKAQNGPTKHVHDTHKNKELKRKEVNLDNQIKTLAQMIDGSLQELQSHEYRALSLSSSSIKSPNTSSAKSSPSALLAAVLFSPSETPTIVSSPAASSSSSSPLSIKERLKLKLKNSQKPPQSLATHLPRPPATPPPPPTVELAQKSTIVTQDKKDKKKQKPKKPKQHFQPRHRCKPLPTIIASPSSPSSSSVPSPLLSLLSEDLDLSDSVDAGDDETDMVSQKNKNKKLAVRRYKRRQQRRQEMMMMMQEENDHVNEDNKKQTHDDEVVMNEEKKKTQEREKAEVGIVKEEEYMEIVIETHHNAIKLEETKQQSQQELASLLPLRPSSSPSLTVIKEQSQANDKMVVQTQPQHLDSHLGNNDHEITIAKVDAMEHEKKEIVLAKEPPLSIPPPVPPPQQLQLHGHNSNLIQRQNNIHHHQYHHHQAQPQQQQQQNYYQQQGLQQYFFQPHHPACQCAECQYQRYSFYQQQQQHQPQQQQTYDNKVTFPIRYIDGLYICNQCEAHFRESDRYDLCIGCSRGLQYT